MVRRLMLTAGMLLLLGGCGDSGGTGGTSPAPMTATPKANGPIGSEAPVLVFCQRQGEGGATLEKRHGGAGGRFKEQVLRTGELPRLRRALAALPAGDSLTRGDPPPLST